MSRKKKTTTTAGRTVPAVSGPARHSVANGYSPLPPGISLDADFHVRNDRIYAHELGNRRRALLEILGGDVNSIAQKAGSKLLELGYQSIPASDKGDGFTGLVFRKAGAGLIQFSHSTSVGDNPAHPSATALLFLDWPVTTAR